MPVLDKRTKVYAIRDLKVAKLTADPFGGAATYAASIDIPGVKKMTVTGVVAKKTLRGDNTLLDVESTLEEINAVIDHAKVDLAALSMMLGVTVVDAGITPNQTSLARLIGGQVAPSQLQYFKIEGAAVDTDIGGGAGDCHVTLYKCKLDGFPPLGFAEEDFQLFNFPVACAPRNADGFWMDVLYNETAVAIA